MTSVAVVGASLAGLTAVRGLRERGFQGAITLIGEEPDLPYERPALSKEFLRTGEPLGLLEDHSEAERLGAEWVLGRRAVGLTAGAPHAVHLGDGRTIRADIVVLATGARPRQLPGFDGAHYLRCLEDARQLRETLARTEHLVVVGAGFIGAEVAASARGLGVEVTLVDLAPVPSREVLGDTVAAAYAAVHARNGVRLLTGVGVRSLSDNIIELTDGTRLPARSVVVGIGAVPNTEWAGTALHVVDGFVTDSRCRTSVPGIYAIGDCARVHDPSTDRHVRGEHWNGAIAQAHTAAAAITDTPAPAPAAPYFWSRQYGRLLQFAGHHAPEVRVIDGELDGDSFTALYERDGSTVGVCALDNPRLFTRHRKLLDRARTTN